MWRPLWTVLGALLGAAAALWGSSRLAWAAEAQRYPGTDLTTVVWRSGAESRPLVPLAVLAVAGVAAAVAVGGWPRRLLGIVLAAGGVVAAVLGLAAGMPAFFPWGHILAVLGGALLLIAGALLVWFSHRLPRLGTSYQRASAQASSDDPDHQMWRALSVGEDPTTDNR